MLCSFCSKLPVLLLTTIWLSIIIPRSVATRVLYSSLASLGSKYRRRKDDGNFQLQNVTIDDELGDPNNDNHFSYYPSITWKQGSGCKDCSAKPDATQAVDGTWHDSSFYPLGDSSVDTAGLITAAAVQFTGPAVYVYCILGAHLGFPDYITDMTFFIDGEPVGTFSQLTNNYSDYQYNTLVYSNTTLENIQHTFRLESGHSGHQALVLLDYLIYTSVIGSALSSSTGVSSASLPLLTNSGSTSLSSLLGPSSTSSPPSINNSPDPKTSRSTKSTGIIAGSAVGAAAFILALCTGAYILLRKHQKSKMRVITEYSHDRVVDASYTTRERNSTKRNEPSLSRLMANQHPPFDDNLPRSLDSRAVRPGEDLDSLPPQYNS